MKERNHKSAGLYKIPSEFYKDGGDNVDQKKYNYSARSCGKRSPLSVGRT